MERGFVWRSTAQGFIGWCKHFPPAEFISAVREKKNVDCAGVITARSKEGRPYGWLILYTAPGVGRRPVVVSGRKALIIDARGHVVRKRYECFRPRVRAIRLGKENGEEIIEVLDVGYGGVTSIAQWKKGDTPPPEFAEAEYILGLDPQDML